MISYTQIEKDTHERRTAMKTSLNERTVSVKIRRIDLCDLLLACTVLDCKTDPDTKKWAKLHDKLAAILEDFDSKQEI